MTSWTSVNGVSTSGYKTAAWSSARREASRVAVCVMASSSSVGRPLATTLFFVLAATASTSGNGLYLAFVLKLLVGLVGPSLTVMGSMSRVELEARTGVCNSGAGVAYAEPRPLDRAYPPLSAFNVVESWTEEGVGEGDCELARIFDISALGRFVLFCYVCCLPLKLVTA